ncbi:MAG TPA: segregation/condensation protein A [Gemmatimonadaceae bacterium]|nr:segregation/condensation protein A [Gemmatimonadaceae bacterium]
MTSMLISDTDRTAFVVELDHFSGPLDLLLSLIKEEQVEITDIPIARIVEQFLLRIHGLGLGAAAEYLEMAARLLRIKAQMLLPSGMDDEGWEDPRSELVRRLLEYQQMREVVDLLERLGEDRRNRFARGWQAPVPPAVVESPLALSLPELLGAVDRVLRSVRDPDMHDVISRALDVDSAIAAVRALLALRSRVQWSDVVRQNAEPWQILSALLALLELARRGEVKLAQHSPFAQVEISRDAASEAA